MEPTLSPYRQALLTAWKMGRIDGTVAATWDIERGAHPVARVARGRSPEAFARYLWTDRPGRPPAGLEVNGPLWYSTGYQEALDQALESQPQAAGHGQRALP